MAGMMGYGTSGNYFTNRLQKPFEWEEPCSGCKGAGYILKSAGKQSCNKCKGTGNQPKKKTKKK